MTFKPTTIFNTLKNAIPVITVTKRQSGGSCTGDQIMEDRGNAPYTGNVENASKNNQSYRKALWTGGHLQLVLMSIPAGEELGVEVHPDTDQFIKVEEGMGEVLMGRREGVFDYKSQISSGTAILVPAGAYHNVKNTGRYPLKIYTVYAPPHHPFGTVDETKADSIARERLAESKNQANT